MPSFLSENQTFKAFRLEIANYILRNNPHISALAADIASHEHIIELCDTYAMRLFLSWLATRYGYNLSALYSDEDQPPVVPAAERNLLSSGIYPFFDDVRLAGKRELFETSNAFLDAAFQPSVELAGALYEHLTSHELEVTQKPNSKPVQFIANIRTGIEGKYGRRKKGQFYTPPWVVDYCLEKSLSPGLNDLMKRLQQPSDISIDAKPVKENISSPFLILDPACGTGNFLLGILRFLISRGVGNQELLQAAGTFIYGRDVDGKAVSIAIWSIVLAVIENHKGKNDELLTSLEWLLPRLRRNLQVTDSVFDSFASKMADAERFDLVITNPPYISFGSRNQEKLLPSTSSYLRQHFSISAEYKIRLNSIFQEVALNYVKDGGKICLFIPNSFLTGQGYSKLRAALLKRTRILSFSELPENTMKGAVVGRWCVAIYQRVDELNGELNYPVDLTSFESSGNGSASHIQSHYKIEASHLVTRDQNRFRLVFQKLDEDLAVKLESLKPLSSIARGHTGIRAREGQRTIISTSQETAVYRKGIKSGSKVTPYRVEWDGTWLKVDPKLLFGGGFDARVIENPKIMMRQTADRIIAACDETGLYHLNNVHSFSGQLVGSGSAIDVYLLLGLMNSNVWHYLYRLKTREDGRVLAQIDIETVESMPLPECDEGLTKRLSVLSKTLSENRSNVAANEHAINQIVYGAYQLSHSEIEHIERSLGVGYNSALLQTGAG